MADWKLQKFAVNSKPLFDEITEYIHEGLDETSMNWFDDMYRESFVEVIDEWLEQYADEGRIEQWKVVCDSRNNKTKDIEDGKFILDVYYKQWNCLNTTHLHYIIQMDEDDISIIF